MRHEAANYAIGWGVVIQVCNQFINIVDYQANGVWICASVAD